MIATSALLKPENVQEVYRELAISEIDKWSGAKKGGCRIIAPSGDVIAHAAVGEETILTSTVSLETVLEAKANIDVGGHYSRPDVLQLHVNRRPLERVVVSDVIVIPDDRQISENNERQGKIKVVERVE